MKSIRTAHLKCMTAVQLYCNDNGGMPTVLFNSVTPNFVKSLHGYQKNTQLPDFAQKENGVHCGFDCQNLFAGFET